MLNTDIFLTLPFIDLPDACFTNPVAKMLNGYINCYPKDVDNLHRVKIDVSDELLDPKSVANVMLILESIPIMAVKFSGSNQRINIGKNSASGFMYITFKGAGTVTLGENVKTVGTSFFVSSNQTIHIGDDCLLSTAHLIAVPPPYHLFNLVNQSPFSQSSLNGIFLEPHVWIAAETIVQTGIKIGAGSVVGMNALVRDNIAPQSLAVGAPAVTIKHNISWTFAYNGDGKQDVQDFILQLIKPIS